MAVEADLDQKREPSLYPYREETQAGMLHVEVQMGALSPFEAQFKFSTLLIAIDSECSTTLDAVEHRNETFAHAIALGDVASQVLFVDVAAFQVLEGPAAGLGQGFGSLANIRCQAGDKALEILPQHLGLSEVLLENLHPIQAAKRSLEANTVKTMKNAHDVTRVFL
jgi:hypothetical protein